MTRFDLIQAANEGNAEPHGLRNVAYSDSLIVAAGVLQLLLGRMQDWAGAAPALWRARGSAGGSRRPSNLGPRHMFAQRREAWLMFVVGSG